MPFYQEDTGNGSRKTKDLFTREWIQGEAGEQKDLFLPGFFPGREFRERRSFFFQGIDQGIDQGEDLFSREKDYLVYLVYNVI